MVPRLICFFFFFFNDTATTEIYTLSLHDALPIYRWERSKARCARSSPNRSLAGASNCRSPCSCDRAPTRSEEHTSELQSLTNLVCRLLLEKKKKVHTDLTQPLDTSNLSLLSCSCS